MGMSRALFEDQSAPQLTPKEVEENKKNKDKLVDKVPGDKGSTVDKIRQANERLRKAIDEE